jgi:selenide,water dikinase
VTDTGSEPPLTSLAHGGGCGCKLAPGLLERLLGGAGLGPVPPDLIVDASTRDDAAVYRLTDDIALVATTDFFTPIVDDPFEFGRIAATNAISDVYAMGGRPIMSLAIAGMPLGKISPDTMSAVLRGGRSVAEAAQAPVAGGHSIDSAEPIYGLAVLGVVHPKRVLTNAGAKEGDVLILGKPLGIGVFSAAYRRREIAGDQYDAMIRSATLLNRPGGDLGAADGIGALTDVTGFGLVGHLLEICRASGVGAVIDRETIPVFDGVRELIAGGVFTGASSRNWSAVETSVSNASAIAQDDRVLLCDPQTSGGLLVSCRPEAVGEVLRIFHGHGHAAATVIGRIAGGAPEVRIV